VNSVEILKKSFKPNFPEGSKTLINKFLLENPAMRLGMLRNGMDDIWMQPFFAGLSEMLYQYNF
jgi:hypothetical protein